MTSAFSKNLLITGLLSVFLVLLASVFPQNAQAQFLPGATTSEAAEAPATGIDGLVEEARNNGSTIIIIKPDDASANTAAADADAMAADQFFKARARIEQIFKSASTLPENTVKTLELASPDGTYFWLWRAIGTALLGLFAGSLAIRPIMLWGRDYFRYMYDPDPATTADKAKYLLFRVGLALVYVAIFFVAAMAVAVVLDSGHEASRRLIFEIIAGYLFYRLMIRAVSWNLFAYDAPSHRIVNLSDDEANKIHREWGVIVTLAIIIGVYGRFFSFTGEEQNYAGLTFDNIRFIQIGSAFLITLILVIATIKDWKIWQKIFSPRQESASLYKLRTMLTRLVPAAFILYMVVAMAMFVYRIALDLPNPGVIIASPFVVFWASLMTYGIVIIVIQAIYNRRIRRFEERAAAERERLEEQAKQVDTESGEQMVVNLSSADFEYQPVFKRFFELSAMAIIATFAVGELVRSWGVDLSAEDNFWSSLLEIALAISLCWFAYNSFSTFIDKRLEEEAGPASDDDQEEIGGEGGGAGATRMATLLPIIRYVMVTLILSIAVMVVLSRMGFDIGPIFAGAGVVGIAVGFGAQTLIRDIFSGAFFLLDDAFRKGEYVEIENIRGTVERISVRSFQLRHHLGALHTIPFGEIKQLTNYSRDWVMMKLPLRVTYNTDVEKVRKLVKKLGQELLKHPQVGDTFMQPLKSQGVYKMEDSAMIIRVKFMTKPGEQFVTRKVVYEAIQDLFAKEGIQFAHKEVTVRLADGQKADELTEEERKAVTSAARSVIDAETEAATPDAGR